MVTAEAKGLHSRRRYRRALVRVALVLLGLLGTTEAYVGHARAGGHGSAATARGRLLGTVSLDPGQQARALPDSFLGFSQEYNLVPSWIGTYRSGPNPVLEKLFSTLRAAGSGTPLLRIGGGSTDGAMWDPTGKRPPRGIYFGIDYPWALGLSAFLRSTHAPVILGVNFALRKVSIAADWAKAALRLLPARSIREFEVGNEPDIYSTRPFNIEAKHPGFTRRRSYSPADYIRELIPFLRALHRSVPKAHLAGPALCCETRWVDAMPGILSRAHRYLSLVTMHRYPLNACGVKPGRPGYPTPASLLAPGTLLFNALQFNGLANLARRYRLGLRLDEVNSAACGGAIGASNTFASALWAANWLFAMDAARVAGVDFHGSSPLYTPFSFRYGTDGWSGHVDPEFYGLLLFAAATAHHSRYLPGTRVQPSRRGMNIWSWGYYDRRDHVMRIAVLNLGTRLRGRLRFAAGARTGSTATIERLTAPSLRATRNIRWGGRYYAAITDGRQIGAPEVERVRRHGHNFVVSVGPASALLLTVQYRPA